MSVRILNIGIRLTKWLDEGNSERSFNDSDLGLGPEWGFPRAHLDTAGPSAQVSTRRGVFGKQPSSRPWGLLRRRVRGEEAPGPCFRSPWRRSLECHSGSPLPRHIPHPDSQFCCFKSMYTAREEPRRRITTPFFPPSLPCPHTERKKKKEKKTACLKETTGSFWCHLGATVLSSGFLFRDLFASCKSLAALTLNLITFHVFVVLLLHQFLFVCFFIILLLF